jgi:hypothetical protein
VLAAQASVSVMVWVSASELPSGSPRELRSVSVWALEKP